MTHGRARDEDIFNLPTVSLSELLGLGAFADWPPCCASVTIVALVEGDAAGGGTNPIPFLHQALLTLKGPDPVWVRFQRMVN